MGYIQRDKNAQKHGTFFQRKGSHMERQHDRHCDTSKRKQPQNKKRNTAIEKYFQQLQCCFSLICPNFITELEREWL